MKTEDIDLVAAVQSRIDDLTAKLDAEMAAMDDVVARMDSGLTEADHKAFRVSSEKARRLNSRLIYLADALRWVKEAEEAK